MSVALSLVASLLLGGGLSVAVSIRWVAGTFGLRVRWHWIVVALALLGLAVPVGAVSQRVTGEIAGAIALAALAWSAISYGIFRRSVADEIKRQSFDA